MNLFNDLYPEYQLISLLVQFPEHVADQIFATISPEMLKGDDTRKIFSCCLELRKNDREIDVLAFQDKPDLLPQVIECLPIVPGVNGVSYTPLFEKIIEDYKRRKIARMAHKIMHDAKNKAIDLNEIFRTIEETRTALNVTTSNNFRSLADIIDESGNPEAYEEMTVSCLQTGWKQFDSNVIIKPGDLIILAGRPSSGKTDFALQFAKQIGRHGYASAIFSLETAGQYLNKRLAGGSSLQEYLDGCAKNANLPIYIDDNPIQSIFSARAQIQYAYKRFGIKVAILDYLTLMNAPKNENRNREVEELTKGLKVIARETNIPILVLAQLNRAVEVRRDKRPMLSDLRDSGAIEQVIDICLMTYSPTEPIDDISDVTNYLEIISTKQREGAKGAMQFFYDRKNKVIGDWAGDKLSYEKYLDEQPF